MKAGCSFTNTEIYLNQQVASAVASEMVCNQGKRDRERQRQRQTDRERNLQREGYGGDLEPHGSCNLNQTLSRRIYANINLLKQSVLIARTMFLPVSSSICRGLLQFVLNVMYSINLSVPLQLNLGQRVTANNVHI